MHSDKKEDTWRPADLSKHIREEGHGDDYVRRREDSERKRRGGESTERRHRDPEKESKGERDHHRERERTRERGHQVEKDRYADRRKEGSRDRRGEKDSDRRDEKRRERDTLRKQHQESQRHKEENEDERKDKDRREKHGHRKHPGLNEARDPREEHRRHKEERERRHGERGYQDEKRKYDSESREHRGPRGSGEEVRHHGGDRERAERDRERRRHRERAEEEEELERNHHKDRTKESEKTEVIHAEDPAEQEYEDDFEDYEEDFEEMEESANEDEDDKEPQHPGGGEEREELSAQRRKEIEAIQRAMDEENERVGTAQSRGSTSREEEDEPKWSRGSEKSQNKESQRGKFIDFVAAKQREVSKKVATKQKKRSTELLRLIDLDSSLTFSLLDLPPVNEYDMYIRNFGTANTKQAYVQCNEDNADRDIQTEEIDVCDKWTQHPPEHSGACGDPNVSQEAQEKTLNEINYDSQRLAAFLLSASQVMVVLLEEDQAEKTSLRKLQSPTDTPSFSDGTLLLNTKLPFLYGRHIRLLHFSQVQRHTMMSVHNPTTEPSAVRLDSYTIVCIWNIREPSRPQKVLVYESEIHCCCFSPGKATLVFAGTSVGSVVLWDLREHARIHHCMKIGEEEWTFRQPTFSTDAVLAGSGHLSSVTSVEVVPSAAAAAGGLRPEVPLLASEEESSGSSFQLASLDENGVLNFWVVVELPKANEAGSPTDLGLRPGGKVKLLHSSSLLTAERVSPQDALNTGALQTQHLKFLPTDCNHFFIGTNMGLVNHGTSHGLKAPPKFYRFQEAGVRPVDVTSINFSPFVSHLFLVGCSDGSIRLHAVSHEQPVAEWANATAGEPVVSLQWTKTRPTVFCALDAASKLHIWDLMSSDSEPVVTERIHTDRVTAVAMFGDSGQHNTYSGIGLAHESGKIEMLYFSRKFTVPMMAEEEKLESLMGDAF
ncbi:cytoplasmic dynein 2 intermediate chain 1 [Tautogolabrus adspersus]